MTLATSSCLRVLVDTQLHVPVNLVVCGAKSVVDHSMLPNCSSLCFMFVCLFGKFIPFNGVGASGVICGETALQLICRI